MCVRLRTEIVLIALAASKSLRHSEIRVCCELHCGYSRSRCAVRTATYRTCVRRRASRAPALLPLGWQPVAGWLEAAVLTRILRLRLHLVRLRLLIDLQLGCGRRCGCQHCGFLIVRTLVSRLHLYSLRRYVLLCCGDLWVICLRWRVCLCIILVNLSILQVPVELPGDICACSSVWSL